MNLQHAAPTVVEPRVASSIVGTVEADPIFAAIREHWSAYEALPALGRAPRSPEGWEPIDRECEAFQRLVETPPATIAGVRALADHLRRFLDAEEVWVGSPLPHQNLWHAYSLEAALRLALSGYAS